MSILAVLGLTACEKTPDVADDGMSQGIGQVKNSLLQVRTRASGSVSEGATVAYPVTVYVFHDWCVLRLELTNLLNQRNYSYTVFDGINTYTYDYTLCGRTMMLRATFKLWNHAE